MSVSVFVLLLRLRLRASSCRSPRPARRGFRRGAAAATAAIAAASLAMWLHFVYSPARRPPPPPALLALLPLLLLRRRLPPSRALASSLARSGLAAAARLSSLHLRPGAAADTETPGAAADGAEAGRQARPRVGSCGRPGPARWSLRRCRGCCWGCCCPARRRRRRRRRRRWPLAGSLAPSAALTHVLLTEQNPNYSPALPPTSATLSHWAAGLFRRNNKTCQSGEGQRDD